MDSRRQQKVASLLKQEMSTILQRQGPGIYGAAFVTITDCKVTPDLLSARFYLSMMAVDDKEAVLKALRTHVHELRRTLGNNLAHHLRRIPELSFFFDDTIEEAMRIDKILKQNPSKEVEVDPDDYEEDADLDE